LAIWGAPSLSPRERQALEHDYRYGKTRVVRQHSHIVLLAGELSSQAELARVVGCSVDTVRRTLARYERGGREGLRSPVRLRHSRARRQLGWLKSLAHAMEAGPRPCGVDRPTWTAPLLARYLAEQTGVEVSERTVRRGLSELGYVCRRSTWVLRQRAEAEPDYLPKGKGSKPS
jgi:transposase